MSVELFYAQPGASADTAEIERVLAAAKTEPTLELPDGVLHPLVWSHAASILGLSDAELADVLHLRAALKHGVVLDAEAFHDAEPEEDFSAWSGTAGLARADERIGRMVLRSVPLRPGDAAVGRGERLPREPDAVAWRTFQLRECASMLKDLTELDAPEIVLRAQRAHLQLQFELLIDAHRGARSWTAFEALSPDTFGGEQLGRPAPPRRGYLGGAVDGRQPRRTWLVDDLVLLELPRLVVVVSVVDGAVVDHFITGGMTITQVEGSRVVLTDLPHVALREVRQRRWLAELPDDLEAWTAWTLDGMSMAVDLKERRWYCLDPYDTQDHAWPALTPDARHVLACRGKIVLETSTGRPICELANAAQEQDDEPQWDVASFSACRASFRFVRREGDQAMLCDEHGEPLAQLDRPDATLDVSGERVVVVDDTSVVVSALDAAGTASIPSCRIDLRPLIAALAPDELALGSELAEAAITALGYPWAVAASSSAELREAVHAVLLEPPSWETDDEAELRAACRGFAPIPERLPFTKL